MISSASGTHISPIITSRKNPNTKTDGTYESITTEQTARTTLNWGRYPDSHHHPHESRVELPVLRNGSSKEGGKGIRKTTSRAESGNVNCVDTTGDGNVNCVDCENCWYVFLRARSRKLMMAVDPNLLFFNREGTDGAIPATARIVQVARIVFRAIRRPQYRSPDPPEFG